MAKNTSNQDTGDLTPEELAELENARAAESAALAQSGIAAAAAGEEIEHDAESVAALVAGGNSMPTGWAYNPAVGFFQYAEIVKSETAPQRVTAPEG